jgi:predicted metal-dependent phosphoesterase TrpH
MITYCFSRKNRVIFDLHSHSTASDGVLSPSDLVKRAAAQGVQVVALTDHDDVRGIEEADHVARQVGVTLVPGVEVSVTWSGRTVHIVGLYIDPGHDGLRAGLLENRAGRVDRARRMGEELSKVGIGGAYDAAHALAPNKELISRTHFARFLIDRGYAKDMKAVFKRFLKQGKPGYVQHQWASLGDAVGWIQAAGGIAVLAHPGRYDMGRGKLEILLAEFKACGGTAMEVVSGSHTADQVPVFARYAQEFDLYASCGSDFHAPGEGGRELGRMLPMPESCRPVWLAR